MSLGEERGGTELLTSFGLWVAKTALDASLNCSDFQLLSVGMLRPVLHSGNAAEGEDTSWKATVGMKAQ